MLESVERNMTIIIYRMRNIYLMRILKLLNLLSLERRGIKLNLIETFNWRKGFNKSEFVEE